MSALVNFWLQYFFWLTTVKSTTFNWGMLKNKNLCYRLWDNIQIILTSLKLLSQYSPYTI